MNTEKRESLIRDIAAALLSEAFKESSRLQADGEHDSSRRASLAVKITQAIAEEIEWRRLRDKDGKGLIGGWSVDRQYDATTKTVTDELGLMIKRASAMVEANITADKYPEAPAEFGYVEAVRRAVAALMDDKGL
jgi:hypothetical protein